MTQLNPNDVREIRSDFQGDILLAGDPGYDSARSLWNGMFDRHPALIARCAAPEDVKRVLKFTRDRGLVLGVKGGGHQLAGKSVVDDGVVIDLSRMRSIHLNAANRRVRVEGGALLGDLDNATQQAGMAVPSGIISHTGVAGLTLGGGFGWISRKHGLSIDKLHSAEVVTAGGDVVVASEKENTDLFWGLRGGGGNFGIATALEFNCAEIGKEVYSGLIVKRFDDLRNFLAFYREYVRTLPDEMTVWMVLRKAPPLPFLPADVHGKLIVVVPIVWLGDPAEGEKLLKPIRDQGVTVGEHVGLNPWAGWQSALDGLVPHGARNYWRSNDLTGIPDAAADHIMDFMHRIPTDDSQIVLVHLEGAVSRVPEMATAYPHRKTPFLLNVEARWHDVRDDQRCLQWTQEFHESLRQWAKGVYVNFLGDEGDERVRQAYSTEGYNQLAQLKGKWDPHNLFSQNQNIRPANGTKK